jgi:hydrogenase-4 component E
VTASTAYSSVLDFAIGALLLTAVLIVWRRDLAALVRMLSWQGTALAAIPITTGVHTRDDTLIAVGVLVGLLRAAAIPRLVRRLLPSESGPRDSAPVINTTASLLTVALLTALAYAVSRPIVKLAPTPATHAAPIALAVVLIGVFILVTRRRAISQVVGFLVMDNGIAALAFLTTAGVPLVVELGASLDILLAVIILQVLTGRMRLKFGSTDLDELRELHD